MGNRRRRASFILGDTRNSIRCIYYCKMNILNNFCVNKSHSRMLRNKKKPERGRKGAGSGGSGGGGRRRERRRRVGDGRSTTWYITWHACRAYNVVHNMVYHIEWCITWYTPFFANNPLFYYPAGHET